MHWSTVTKSWSRITESCNNRAQWHKSILSREVLASSPIWTPCITLSYTRCNKFLLPRQWEQWRINMHKYKDSSQRWAPILASIFASFTTDLKRAPVQRTVHVASPFCAHSSICHRSKTTVLWFSRIHGNNLILITHKKFLIYLSFPLKPIKIRTIFSLIWCLEILNLWTWFDNSHIIGLGCINLIQ